MAGKIECNEASNLDNQQFRLNKINEIKDYFIAEIREKRRLALFPAGTIVRDPHHLKSPTRREQDLNLRRT